MGFLKKHKLIVIISSGATVEWLEFTAYLYLAPRLAELFFPDQGVSGSLLSVFGVFFIAYLTRPLGVFFFGFIGDRYGRKATLTFSVLLMTAVTTGIGFLPTWESIGLFAPLLLLIFRIGQGLAIAGEFTNAAVLLIELDKRNPYLAGSWSNWGATLGVGLGVLVTALVSMPEMPDWRGGFPFYSVVPRAC